MKEVLLDPIIPDASDLDEIMDAIVELFRKEIYLPLVQDIGSSKNVLTNSKDDLLDAIRKGRIYYHRGAFRGRFNSALSRELRSCGAVWDRTQGTWKVSQSKLSKDIRQAIVRSREYFKQKLGKIQKRLDSIVPVEVADKLKVEEIFDTTLWKANKQVESNMKSVSVKVKLTDEQRRKIAREYTENLQLSIQDFTSKEIVELRRRIEKAALEGVRPEDIAEEIQESYGVSHNKARFLAKQESRVLVSKFIETRMQAAGLREYYWTCVAGSKNHPVRPMHKALNGKKFSFDNPPVVNKNGDRKNPGQDYGCRCYAVPVVQF